MTSSIRERSLLVAYPSIITFFLFFPGIVYNATLWIPVIPVAGRGPVVGVELFMFTCCFSR